MSKNTMVLECFGDHNLVTNQLMQPNVEKAKRFLTFQELVQVERVFLVYHTLPALREGILCPPSGERMVNQEDSFDLDKLLTSQKTFSFFNIWLNQSVCYQIMVSKALQNHCVFLTFSCLHKKCFKTFEFFGFSTLLQLCQGCSRRRRG